MSATVPLKVRVVGVRTFYGLDGDPRWMYGVLRPDGDELVRELLCLTWADAMAYAHDEAVKLQNERLAQSHIVVLHNGDVASWARYVNLTASGDEPA